MDAQHLDEMYAHHAHLAEQSALVQTIDRGVQYLYRHQYPNGEFCCYMALDEPMQQTCAPDSTAFPTAVIANTLLGLVDHPMVATMLTRTISFFQYQLMRGGLLNQYTIRNHWFAVHPPSVDGTAYAGTLFKTLGVDYPHYQTRSLLLTNRKTQGGLYTWIIPRPRLTRNRLYWRTGLRVFKQPLASLRFWLKHGWMRSNIDKVVNANTLHYLGLNDETKFILDYLLHAVTYEPERQHDSWYASPISFYYALGQNYNEGIKQLESIRSTVLERLLTHQQSDGLFGKSILETAQALSALLYWHGPAVVIKQTVNVLLKHQGRYGEWPRATLFYSGPQMTIGWGSEELTTGFCLEALAAYQCWILKSGADQ